MAGVAKAVLDGLTKGIQAELAAYVFYKKAMTIVKDEKLSNLLAQLAGEEKEHYRVLEGQYDSLVRSEMWNTISDVLRREGLPDIDEQMEDVHQEFAKEITEASSPVEILQIALILEERAYNLYNDLSTKVDDPKGKETYQNLARFESGHAAKIKKMMESYK